MNENLKIAIEQLEKAGERAGHKYYKRIPKHTGKGFTYFYTKGQYDHYKKTGELPKEGKTGGIFAGIMAFFGIKSEKDAKERVKTVYERNKADIGVNFTTFADHMNEYLLHKDKWDAKIKGVHTGTGKGAGGKKGAKPAGKKKKTAGGEKTHYSLALMKTIAGIVGGVKPAEEEKPVAKGENKATLTEHEQNTIKNLNQAEVSYREGREDTFKHQQEKAKWQTEEGLKKLHNELKKDIPNIYPYIDKEYLEKTGKIKLTEEGNKKFNNDKISEKGKPATEEKKAGNYTKATVKGSKTPYNVVDSWTEDGTEFVRIVSDHNLKSYDATTSKIKRNLLSEIVKKSQLEGGAEEKAPDTGNYDKMDIKDYSKSTYEMAMKNNWEDWFAVPTKEIDDYIKKNSDKLGRADYKDFNEFLEAIKVERNPKNAGIVKGIEDIKKDQADRKRDKEIKDLEEAIEFHKKNNRPYAEKEKELNRLKSLKEEDKAPEAKTPLAESADKLKEAVGGEKKVKSFKQQMNDTDIIGWKSLKTSIESGKTKASDYEKDLSDKEAIKILNDKIAEAEKPAETKAPEAGEKGAKKFADKTFDEQVKQLEETYAGESISKLKDMMGIEGRKNHTQAMKNILKKKEAEEKEKEKTPIKELSKEDYPEKIKTEINNPKYSAKTIPPEGYTNTDTIERIISKKDIKGGFEIFGERFFIAKGTFGDWTAFEVKTGKKVGSGKTIKEAMTDSQHILKQAGPEKLKAAMESVKPLPMEKATQLLMTELEKAKKMPVGTVSGKYKKVAEGKWVLNKQTSKSGEKPVKKDEKPKKPEEKPAEKPKLKTEHKGIIKTALKKVANILAEALSARDPVKPAAEAVEQTGENIEAKNKEKQRLAAKTPAKKTATKPAAKPAAKPAEKPATKPKPRDRVEGARKRAETESKNIKSKVKKK